MNKLDQMNIADLSEKEVHQLVKYEKEINSIQEGEKQEIYLLALKK